jgi:hypothetical protein
MQRGETSRYPSTANTPLMDLHNEASDPSERLVLEKIDLTALNIDHHHVGLAFQH